MFDANFRYTLLAIRPTVLGRKKIEFIEVGSLAISGLIYTVWAKIKNPSGKEGLLGICQNQIKIR